VFRLKHPIRTIGLALLLAAQAAQASASGLDVDRTMDEATARAMLGRFGYGADPASLAAAMRGTPRRYLTRAIQGQSTLPPDIAAEIAALPISRPLDSVWAEYGPGGTARNVDRDADARKALQKAERAYIVAAVQARLLTMANSDNQGHEALLSFWLNHFSIYGPKAVDKLLAWDYTLSLERAMADDSFESLLRASFFHPAMQVYLDNARSTAPDSAMARFAEGRGKTLGVNENLAREVMELHTLGVGSGYTQQDVQQLARIITGAGVYSPRMRQQALERAGATRNGLFLFDPRRHDFGAKTFLGQDFPAGHGLDEIERALHMLAASPATARHISFKLARRFLSDDPPGDVVDAMAQAYLRSGGRISATLMPLIASPAFAASLKRPDKFKEPIDFIVSASRAACSGRPIGNGLLLAAAARDMGEAPYLHSTPDGYGARESDWLSPPAMAKRVRFAMGVATGRLPLASAGADDGRAVDEAMKPRQPFWMKGAACAPDAATVAVLVGPLSAATQSSGQGLPDEQRIAFELASPEFMRR
jgi:uncharacterized protein (DUF1800 family)